MNTVVLLYQKALDRLQGYSERGSIINIKTQEKANEYGHTQSKRH